MENANNNKSDDIASVTSQRNIILTFNVVRLHMTITYMYLSHIIQLVNQTHTNYTHTHMHTHNDTHTHTIKQCHCFIGVLVVFADVIIFLTDVS